MLDTVEIIRRELRWEGVSTMGSDGPVVNMIPAIFPMDLDKVW